MKKNTHLLQVTQAIMNIYKAWRTVKESNIVNFMEKYASMFKKYKIDENEIEKFLAYLEYKKKKPNFKTVKNYDPFLERLFSIRITLLVDIK